MRRFVPYLGIALAPVLLLKLYVMVSGDLDARWLIIRYGVLFVLWFIAFVSLGVCKGTKTTRR